MAFPEYLVKYNAKPNYIYIKKSVSLSFSLSHTQMQTDRQTYTYKHACTHTQTDRQTDTDTHSHRHTHRHTDIHTHTHTKASRIKTQFDMTPTIHTSHKLQGRKKSGHDHAVRTLFDTHKLTPGQVRSTQSKQAQWQASDCQ